MDGLSHAAPERPQSGLLDPKVPVLAACGNHTQPKLQMVRWQIRLPSDCTPHRLLPVVHGRREWEVLHGMRSWTCTHIARMSASPRSALGGCACAGAGEAAAGAGAACGGRRVAAGASGAAAEAAGAAAGGAAAAGAAAAAGRRGGAPGGREPGRGAAVMPAAPAV